MTPTFFTSWLCAGATRGGAAPAATGSTLRGARRARSVLVVLPWTLVLAGCVHRTPEPVLPRVDGEQLALALEDRSRLREPVRIVFAWNLNEAGMRVRGRGVARIEPPYRARLDLFLGNGETVVRAALVDGELRLPPGAPRDILPPADLMWGVLGVFRPEFGMENLGAQLLPDGGRRLRYRYPDGSQLRFTVTDGRVSRVERVHDGHVTERVELTVKRDDPYPVEARYRNLSAFRELRLSRESVERVESFPPDIWEPSGGVR